MLKPEGGRKVAPGRGGKGRGDVGNQLTTSLLRGDGKGEGGDAYDVEQPRSSTGTGTREALQTQEGKQTEGSTGQATGQRQQKEGKGADEAMLPVSASASGPPFASRRRRSCCPFSSRVVTVAVMMSFEFGYNIAVMNVAAQPITLSFEWCGNAWNSQCHTASFRQSVINSIVFAGAVLGAFFAGPLMKRGRRFALQSACVCFIAGGAAAFLARNYWWLVISRTISGIGLGLVTVGTPVYISEMSADSDRGYYGTMHNTFIAVGILAAIAIGLPLTSNFDNDPHYVLDEFTAHWWRVMLGFIAVPATLGLICFTCICNSNTPHELVAASNVGDAAVIMGRIMQAESHLTKEVEDKVVEIMHATEESRDLHQVSLTSAIQDSFYRRALLIGYTLAALQQLSGINVITSTSNELFFNAGLSAARVTQVSTGMACANVLMSWGCSSLVGNLGRRPLLMYGLLIMALGAAPVGILRLLADNFHWSFLSKQVIGWVSVASSVIFVLSFAVSLGPVVWLYLSEIYPVEIRGKALGMCGVINWLSSFGIVFFAKFLNVTTSFNVFAGVCMVGFAFSWAYVIETKGTSIEDSPLTPRSGRSGSNLIRSISSSSLVDPTEIRSKVRQSSSSPDLKAKYKIKDMATPDRGGPPPLSGGPSSSGWGGK
uniref:Hexose transporter 1 n=1 Tax=Chromera velia CCMP2878 TaxID=1169474 RepID=A0A0G4I3A6_9ALVE|eukprot:Cvel_10606.t1-p1 / transcript=Cvel_10606.t1 / gene=Cvel_10606 / organism=Chromera_velia_CCMP2878 / gene_product=Plastidic glucose transporter 4, putative / transcript_product=Plastidic glucose transporter 4, putative / location=Cvel_scaffold643:56230-64043(+) / protein_length=656 / sequence_SO=supercontig / SO=protein_coding / is_pseudo=false